MKTWDDTIWCYYSAGLHNEPGRDKALNFACVMGGHQEVPGKSVRRRHSVAQSKEGRKNRGIFWSAVSVFSRSKLGDQGADEICSLGRLWGQTCPYPLLASGGSGNSCHTPPSSASISPSLPPPCFLSVSVYLKTPSSFLYKETSYWI